MNPSPRKKTKPLKSVKKSFHPRNKHNDAYDFSALIKTSPQLNDFVKINQFGNESIDFADPQAVKALNAALLAHHYGIVAWDIPAGFLCPPIPGRVDYIHYVADLLQAKKRSDIKLLDIGTGANGIYSLLAAQVYGWQCIATDIDSKAINNLVSVLQDNASLEKQITLRLQVDKNHIFSGIITKDEFYDVTVCNPPFHDSLEAALAGNQKKRQNLALNRKSKNIVKASKQLNFGGQNSELWCEGGESRFLRLMMNESKQFAKQCRWFTSLVSKNDNVKMAKKRLVKLEAKNVKVINMNQGNKVTRILAWSFFDET